MRIRSDQRIREQYTVSLINDRRKIFQIDLMNDSRIGRNNLKIVKTVLCPFKERIAFVVSFKFALDVEIKRLIIAGTVDLDGMINDHVNRNVRIDRFDVSSAPFHFITHRSQIDHCRNARQILQNNAFRFKNDVMIMFFVPIDEVFQVPLKIWFFSALP